MKNIFYSITAVLVVVLGSCGKEELGRDYDFSDAVEPYIVIAKAGIDATPESTATVRFTMRTGLSKPVTVKYNVSGSVDLGDQTATFSRYATTKDVEIAIPAGTATPSETVVKLVSATKEDGTPLVIGRYGVAEGEMVTITIDAP